MTGNAAPDIPSALSTTENHLYLVDGSGYIFRAFHALPQMNRSDGTPTNAVFGFTTMLMKLVEDLEADHLAVIFDTKRLTFRNDIFPDYKANRDEPPDDLKPQFSLIRDAVRAFRVPCLEMEGFEADDLIATYTRQARKKGMRVTVVSSDKDLMQLVNDGVDMYDPMKNRSIGRAEVIEKFGVGPERVIDVQSLAGDSVDNVPGVPGIGIKTAAQLITEYGDLDTLLARAEEIKQPKRRQNLIEFADQARISRDLVRLKDDVDVVEPLERLAVEAPDDATVLAFLKEMEFKRLITRFESELADGNGAATPGAAPAEGSVGSPDPIGDISYELVQESADLERWIAAAYAEGIVAVDTETTSLNAMRAELVGVSMSIAPGKACYIPLGHTSGEAQGNLLGEPTGGEDGPKQIPRAEALARLKPLLEDPSVLKVLHNTKYDALVLAQDANGGIELSPVDDTMCMSYVLEGGMHGHGLDDLSELHFGHTNITFADVCGKGKTKIPFSEVSLEQALDYAAEDSDMTIRLHRKLRPELPKAGLLTVYETLERPLIPVLVGMEKAGIKVDPQILLDMSKDFEKRLEELAVQIHELAEEEFKIGSPKQLGDILFDKMGLPGGKKGKTGAYATGADILEELAANGHELPARVLDWRQLAKLKSTYTDALVEAINPDTGRIHTSYSMTGASTGRLSSNDPNLQNIPIRSDEGRKIRTAFIAEPGHKLLAVDYSQIELRLLADIADIESLKQAFRDGIDIHAQTASEVFSVPLKDMDPITRRNAKAINFGIIYGISAFGLARQLGTEPGLAKQYIDAYFERFPGIRDFMEKTKAGARTDGYVTTLFGRRIHIPGIKDNNPARRAFSERAAINAPIQGSAADVIKRAMVRIGPAIRKAGLRARMLLQVHDELLFEVPASEVEETTALVRKVMEAAADPVVQLSVPLIADAGVGDSWSEAH